jgi:uncharacterized protein YjbI with pentapeptide repeats
MKCSHTYEYQSRDGEDAMKIVQIGVLVAVIALIVLFTLGYIFNWAWTGVGPYISPSHPQTRDFQRGKTLYDWLQLFFIPAAIAFGVVWFNRLQQKRDQQLAEKRVQTEREVAEKRIQTEREAAEKQTQTERDIAWYNQREQALQAYFDSLSGLLLEKNLRESQPEDEVRKIARVRTLTVLPRLDGKRKGLVLEFLYESGLIDKGKCIIDLSGADLSLADMLLINLGKADLTGARLEGANLKYANLLNAELGGTSLRRVNLTEANLTSATLYEADLLGADLTGAILTEVDLRGATVTTEQLTKAKSLKYATMPDGTKHD